MIDSGMHEAREDAPRIEAKMRALREAVRSMGSVVVGLSAGVDSSLLAKVSYLELGTRAVAVTAVSPSLSAVDRMRAEGNAREIGIRHVLLQTHEMDSEAYTRNDAMRCFHCKSELARVLGVFAGGEGIASVALGINASDASDFRPGIRAAEEQGVYFPLRKCCITKDEVRAMARSLGLSAHDRPSNSCLSSRIEYGQKIDAPALLMVERAEEMLQGMGLLNVRVRMHGRLARIEVDAASIPLLAQQESRERIVGGLKSLGFAYVSLDLEGFRTGSMNLKLRSSR